MTYAVLAVAWAVAPLDVAIRAVAVLLLTLAAVLQANGVLP